MIAAAAVPVPGLDWAVGAALLARMVPAINKEFGLTPKQIEGLDVHSHAQVHKAVALVGSALIGRLITREALLVALRVVGVRAGRRLRVIWLDAHADFNTAATSPSGNMHGMPLAALCQEAPGPVAAVARPGTLSSADLRLMGIRSVDMDEARAISRLGVWVLGVGALRARGAQAAVREALAGWRAGDHVHVSFDVDFLDPDDAPGVGTRVEGGPPLDEARALFEAIGALCRVDSVDIVELNPSLDEEGKTARIAVELVARLFAAPGRERCQAPDGSRGKGSSAALVF